MSRRALHSRALLGAEGFSEGWVIIDGEVIVEVSATAPEGVEVISYGDAALTPGLVDAHVHINEPGRTEWEGFFTATQAALAGGVTTVVDMPLNCIPVTTSVPALEEKLASLGGQLHVDVGFWGGVVPGNRDELSPLIHRGALGCKAFMCHSGIDDFPDSQRETLKEAMLTLKEAGAPLLVHAELERPLTKPCSAEPSAYESYLHARPSSWEVEAIALLIELVRETGCRAHIVHLSAAEALPMIAEAKAEGLPLSVETCPHYLCLTAEEIGSGQTQFKCAPPIRSAENREALWRGLEEGVIDFIVSDHSPCTPELKKFETGDFHDAWGGISSLQLGLPNIWTEVKRRKIAPAQLLKWLCEGPAHFAGLSHRKGKLAAGYDADIVVWEPESSFVLEPADLRFKHKLSPYLGRHLCGRVTHTYLRGALCYRTGEVLTARGQALLGRGVRAVLLSQLSALPLPERVVALLRCCGSTRWAQELAARVGSLSSDEDLFCTADEVWDRQERADYLEAFSHHPQIGADPAELRKRFASTSDWSAGEQAGMGSASEETIQRLAQGNADYLARFGYIFIVCATGKSASEMLKLLEARLPNDPELELKIAAGEQAKITRLRLEKLT